MSTGVESLIKYCIDHNSIMCYGTGRYGRIVRTYLSESGISIKAFLSSYIPEYRQVLGVPVILIGEYSYQGSDGIIIGAGGHNATEIRCELETKGIESIYIVTSDMIQEMENQLRYRNSFILNNNLCVLYYHRVGCPDTDIWNLSISPYLFESHIRYLLKHYRIIGIDDMTEEMNDPVIMITFDDGYADLIQNALPVLEKYNVPATVFVSTGNIDSNKEFWWDELERIIFNNPNLPPQIEWNGRVYLTDSLENRKDACYKIHPLLKELPPEKREEELQTLAKRYEITLDGHDENRTVSSQELVRLAESPLITIGGHTVTHSCLSMEDIAQQALEIRESKSHIESIIGKQIVFFSYPFGTTMDYSEDTISLLRENGFKGAFTTNPGMAGGFEYTMPRNYVSNIWDEEMLGLMIRRVQCLYG